MLKNLLHDVLNTSKMLIPTFMERASTIACSASLSDTTELHTEEADPEGGHEIQGGSSYGDQKW